MKKCPVCGVMMGDNVARCSMGKYDFQKAAGGDSNAVMAEAQKVMDKREEENLARTEARRSEEEKRLAEIREKINREIATLTAQFESEKLRLDSEYAALQKQAIDEKFILDVLQNYKSYHTMFEYIEKNPDEDQDKLFEEKKVRTVWDDVEEKWYFSIVDVCGVLTDSPNPRNYWKVLKHRLVKEGNETVTNCNQLKLRAEDGKMRLTDVADTEQLFRLIQSIPSPKAEPFKQWMAQVASQRLDQMQDPEKSIDQAIVDYKRLGYSDAWINQRVKSIEVRKELTDEWDRAGVKEGQQYASLTDIITQAWSGKTTKQYKQYKGLKKESLRDNMTNIELALNILAEASTTEISKAKNPKGFKQSAEVAKKGGKIAGDARKKLESQIGRSVISREKASDYLPPADRIQELPEETEDDE